MLKKIKQFFSKTVSENGGRVPLSTNISPTDRTISDFLSVNKLYQFKAGENFGSIFELRNSPLQSIKYELDAKITELKKELDKAEDDKKKELITFAIRNIEELDIYEIKAINNELKREYICKYSEIGA